MFKLTAADFADTGQWKLIISIKKSGLTASLLNTIHPDLEPQNICSISWDDQTTAHLDKKIEEAVYNNPRLLDDFSTKIVIFDNKTLFVPSKICEDIPGFEEDYYTKIFNSNKSDVMSDSDGDITAVWEFAPGVKSFLFRTFPGARITNNLLQLASQCRLKNLPPTISVFQREEESDFIFTHNQDLISAATYPFTKEDMIQQHIFALAKAYCFKVEDLNIIYNS